MQTNHTLALSSSAVLGTCFPFPRLMLSDGSPKLRMSTEEVGICNKHSDCTGPWHGEITWPAFVSSGKVQWRSTDWKSFSLPWIWHRSWGTPLFQCSPFCMTTAALSSCSTHFTSCSWCQYLKKSRDFLWSWGEKEAVRNSLSKLAPIILLQAFLQP